MFSITLISSKEKQNNKLSDPDYILATKTKDYWQNQIYTEEEKKAHNHGKSYGKSQTWEGAFKYCRTLNIKGIIGWSLPTKDELYQMSLLTSRYKDNPGWAHWSSTTVKDNPNLAECINFYGGLMMTCKKESIAYVRCIKRNN